MQACDHEQQARDFWAWYRRREIGSLRLAFVRWCSIRRFHPQDRRRIWGVIGEISIAEADSTVTDLGLWYHVADPESVDESQSTNYLLP